MGLFRLPRFSTPAPAPERVRRLEELSDAELKAHLAKRWYGAFELTDAITPGFGVIPREGYRHDAYRDPEHGVHVPVLMCSVTREKLLSVFYDMMRETGADADVVLETSHADNATSGARRHRDLCREGVDMPVLESTLIDYEDLLLNDGCTGIAVLNRNVPCEVQMDEHKTIIVYANDTRRYEEILADHQVPLDQTIKFITEENHIHSSTDAFRRQFIALATCLCVSGQDTSDDA